MLYRIVISVVLMITLSVFGVAMAQKINTESPVVSISGAALSSQLINQLSSDALNGSGEAAMKIATHYLVAEGNHKEGLFWALIAAENGDVVGQYNAGFLLKDDPDPRNQKRALYWLRIAANRGDKVAISLLRELGASKRSPGYRAR